MSYFWAMRSQPTKEEINLVKSCFNWGNDVNNLPGFLGLEISDNKAEVSLFVCKGIGHEKLISLQGFTHNEDDSVDEDFAHYHYQFPEKKISAWKKYASAIEKYERRQKEEIARSVK